ncbi:LPS assembly lipoprotein LptE [Acidiferrobacter sp.]|jgi:LPS-assembly lipoprotein|uniref:LPS-assembly lipoprotein LptE n=1 Tax=Acidiferrobacter sp. TaxID=1872107 RepID=UPI0026159E6D|nr:LPS assembly lipoprotein LptE [Acidiferrobacter sp.]
MRRLAAAGIAALLLAGCGFHLRGAREFALPASLSVLRVRMPSSGLKYPGLVLVVRHALEGRGVRIVDHRKAPTVVLGGETMNPVIVTLNSNGGASAYLLDYAVTFSLVGPRGRLLMAPRTVRVQREYSFNPENLLAMAREQSYLERRMRASAARQIVWALVSYKGPPAQKSPPAALAHHKSHAP